jgi:uncharacterized alkaline shock family protein YloU
MSQNPSMSPSPPAETAPSPPRAAGDAPAPPPAGAPGTALAPGGRSGGVDLATEYGRTTIANVVVAKIAGLAAREVAGVHALLPQGGGGAIAGLAQRAQRVTGAGADPRTQGVAVEVGEREAAIDLRMAVDYDVSIRQVAEAVRQNVIARVQGMTGLVVREVNIAVDDLYFPDDEPPPAAPRVQ